MTLHVRWPARPASLSRPVGKLRAGLVPIAIGIFGTFCVKACPDYVGNKKYKEHLMTVEFLVQLAILELFSNLNTNKGIKNYQMKSFLP